MPSQNPRVDQLVVEGKNDRHVIWALCKHHDLPQTFEVESAEDGIESLLQSLPVRLKRPGIRRFGIVIDADEKPEQRWQAVRDRFDRAGYPHIPEQPTATGYVLDGYALRMGIWMMPNNSLTGNVEDFSRLLIHAQDPLLLSVEDTVAEIERQNIQRYRPAHRAKAILHTWLAWQDPPGMPMGTAITAKALNPDSPIATEFVGWLRRLFVDE